MQTSGFKFQPDPLTGVPVAQATSGAGSFLLPYYTASALNEAGRYICCTCDQGGQIVPCIIDTQNGEHHYIDGLVKQCGSVLREAVAFHPTRDLLFFATETCICRHDLATGVTEEIFRVGDNFAIKSEMSCGQGHLVFWMYERLAPGLNAKGLPPRGFHMLRNCRSYVVAIDVDSFDAQIVWGDVSPLTHPVLHPQNDDLVLYANQGIEHRYQELFVISRREHDNRKPLKLYSGYDNLDETPVYVGHSFFTRDGWVATQMVEFSGKQADGRYLDMVGYNAIVKADGTCRRRARYPGGNKPIHVHANQADGFWLGDTLPSEGGNDANIVSLMKNNWETGFVQAEPLCVHGCKHEPPTHVHAQWAADGRHVLFNSDYHGPSQIYIVDASQALASWKDVATFERRPQRFYQSNALIADPTIGPLKKGD